MFQLINSSGYLKKQGDIYKTFRKRYHTLGTDLKMKYYDKQDGVLKGSYILDENTKVEFMDASMNMNAKSFGFKLRTQQRVHLMYADSFEDMASWVNQIQRLISEKIRSNTASP